MEESDGVTCVPVFIVLYSTGVELPSSTGVIFILLLFIVLPYLSSILVYPGYIQALMCLYSSWMLPPPP